ncbi:BURP domain protein RD22 isoform X2 [Spinacia oleracea]|uniref:BURP domain protein RD22 isoform X2 n=1 Tax=Spinacia oleracea TaxID=3562 RepID=A0ABM3RUT9_SPIOL|nr:BURP domain protein RD22-like isoform X2 [Spinacia oleracea]
MFFFLFIYFALEYQLALVPSHGAESPAELYWKAKLSNIPMPKLVKDSLELGTKDGISTKLNLMNYGHTNMDHDFERLAPLYKRGFTGAQLPQDGRVMYFTEEMLLKKLKMKLDLIKTDNEAKFLPKSKSVVSSNKLQMILNHLSVDPKSIAAQDIAKTVKECADNGVKGEVRYCATSLKGMVDYVNYKFGKNNNLKVTVLSMEHDIKSVMEYNIQKVQ